MFEYKIRSKQTLWNRAWPGTGPDFLAKHTASERKYGHIHGCQKSLAIQMPKLRKRAIHILSLLKKGGLYLAALKKGGYSGAYPYYVLHRELPPPPPENVVRGDQKLCKRSPYNASLKLSKTYVKY